MKQAGERKGATKGSEAVRPAASSGHARSSIPLRILGLDPGTATTGYGILDCIDSELKVVAYGVITTSADDPPERRLQAIFQDLGDLIARYRPERAAVEQLFFGRNITTAIAVGQARGVLLLAAGLHGVPVTSYNATRIKKTITGHGRASKPQMQYAMLRELGLPTLPEPPDVADALAAALCHYYAVKMAA